ncbi:MAG TPA: hypothetical protein PLB31_12250 [Fimbriimonadaceae bacterium]|nr:hypothetical protein [Fimbriimonadaceae bacterium]HRE93792.1 hypothetical protein [Fimbriimonadaceae bacterium]HRI75229.1 hypothetical protein [Fimbriimonadaceae bacterium]
MRRAFVLAWALLLAAMSQGTAPFILWLGSWGHLSQQPESAQAAAVNPGRGHLNLVSVPNIHGAQELTLNFYSGPAALAFTKQTGISGSFVSGKLGVSPNGSMYVLGTSTTGVNRQLTLVCISTTGALKWTKVLATSTTQNFRSLISVDSSDAVVVAFSVGTQPNFANTILRIKESNGGTIWTKNFTSPANLSSLMTGSGVAVVSHATGTLITAPTRFRGFIINTGSVAFDKIHDYAAVGLTVFGKFNPVSKEFNMVSHRVLGEPSHVYSVNDQGNVVWISSLPDSVTQVPVHDASGRIYTLNGTNTFTYSMVCHSPSGALIYQTPVPNMSGFLMPDTYGVTADGVCYFMHEQVVNNQEIFHISEFSPTGQLNWQSPTPAPWAGLGLFGTMRAILPPSPETGGTLYMTATVSESVTGTDVGNFYYASP